MLHLRPDSQIGMIGIPELSDAAIRMTVMFNQCFGICFFHHMDQPLICSHGITSEPMYVSEIQITIHVADYVIR